MRKSSRTITPSLRLGEPNSTLSIQPTSSECAVSGCTFVGLNALPCSNCGKHVHHMCSNKIYEDKNNSTRYFSKECWLLQDNVVTSTLNNTIDIIDKQREIYNQ